MEPDTVTENWLLQEFSTRARACGLKVDCMGSGKLDSEIVVIAEAPGERECEMKMPLVGGSGKFLWTLLGKYGIRRNQCYVTNVVKQQVAMSTKTDARSPVKTVALEHWEGLLDWELDHLPNVKYILALGNYALHALTGDSGITNWRGSVVDALVGRNRRPIQIVITNNPAHVLRNITLEPMYKFDLAKLRNVIDGNYKRHDIRAIINPTADEAVDYITTLRNDPAPVAFDIETIANETACIGFANNAHEGMCINWRDRTSNSYTPAEERHIRSAIVDWFLSSDTSFIAQNGSFDAGYLWYKDRIHVPKIWFDTLLAHHTLYPRMPHNLGFLTAQYTTHPYYKNEKDDWREGSGDINEFWEYNVKDCCITWAAHKALWKELTQQKLAGFFFNHVMRLQPHLIQMQVCGIKIDEDMKDRVAEDLGQRLKQQLAEVHSHIHVLTGDREYNPNIRSTKQLGELLFNKLGLVGRGSSTNKDNRERMRIHPRTTDEQVKLIDAINVYKVDHKFHSTYATSRIDSDGRMRCEYKQFGTQKAPGRLSSTGVLWGTGTNLQNQPERAYPMFVCDDEYMFSYFDLKQAEAKVVAYKWNVAGLIETFERAETEEGFDVHRANAARIFRVPYDEVPTSDYNKDGTRSLRFFGKKCVHGLNYRMLAPRLAEDCKVPLHQAEEAFYSYHRAFPEIQRAWKRIIDEVRVERQLFSCLGRRMIFLEKITEESFDSVIAFDPQSTIGDKVGGVIYLCQEDKEWPSDARVLLNIHDALIAIHRPKDKEIVQAIMKKHAEAPIPIRGEMISIGTDFKESVAGEDGIHRWSTLMEVQQNT